MENHHEGKQTKQRVLCTLGRIDRRFLRAEKGAVDIDRKKVESDARYDGKFVLRTNASLDADEVAVQYKRLLLVEQFFRTAKSLLHTRPVFHQWDATIRGACVLPIPGTGAVR